MTRTEISEDYRVRTSPAGGLSLIVLRWGEMRRRRGHFCHVCKAVLPNEAFSGKGRARYVCTECSRMSKEERDAIEHADEIFGFMSQSHISEKNVARLKTLASSPIAYVADIADIVLQIAQIKPHKRGRMQVLAENRPDLLRRVNETGLDAAHHW